MRLIVQIVVGLIALVVLWKLLGFVLKLFFGLVNFGLGLLWLALIIGAIVFVAGLVRRMLIRS
jgi:hypothetical protein